MQMKKTKHVNLKLWTIRIRCLICKLITIYRTAENLRHNHPSTGKNMCCEFRLRKQNAGLRDAVVRFVYMVSNHFTCIQNRFYNIAMPKRQNIYDAWCSICVLKSINYARIYTRNQFLQMVQNNSKKTWIWATRFLQANEENKTCEFEIANDSHS